MMIKNNKNKVALGSWAQVKCLKDQAVQNQFRKDSYLIIMMKFKRNSNRGQNHPSRQKKMVARNPVSLSKYFVNKILFQTSKSKED